MLHFQKEQKHISKQACIISIGLFRNVGEMDPRPGINTAHDRTRGDFRGSRSTSKHILCLFKGH